jgi:dolichyl-phosphate beta-glucosyltransferase
VDRCHCYGPGVSPGAAVVIPAYNEAQRLDLEEVRELVDTADTLVVFVDDGSTDATADLLATARDRWPGRVVVLTHGERCGKGEAVRTGLRAAVEHGAGIVGYCDADFATPAGEVNRLVEALRRRADLQAAIGSRVDLLGHEVDRPRTRTAGNRVYSTIASRLLGARIRDTQCGAKAFRAGHQFEAALAAPFGDPWGFDVELLGRLLLGRPPHAGIDPEAIAEIPLERWHHVTGSKLRPADGLQSLVRLPLVRRRIRRWRTGDLDRPLAASCS